MNEITRIHIAKTAYDIEIAAKKQLENYIKSLETYTQDAEVLSDIEIRITELLSERGVAAGSVISSEDVEAVRKQLGEPYEFADGEGDIAVGAETKTVTTGRRLYRSLDDAVLGGVLSGIATYFNVNPLWIRIAFIVLVCISFGLAAFVYVLFWIIVPPARTATEKLQLAGKDVTLESIKEINSVDDGTQPNGKAPILQQALFLGLGSLSLISAVGVFAAAVWIVIAALTFSPEFADVTNGFAGLGDGATWIVWLVFWIFIFGLVLLASLFGLIAYAFFVKKLSKKVLISCVVITVLGLTSAAAVIGISATQSIRVANETRSMVRDSSGDLPKEFSNVKTVTFDVTSKKTDSNNVDYFGTNAAIHYMVDEDGPLRYQLSALPNTKPSIKIEGTHAIISLSVPESYRNAFVQPILVVYGPALDEITSETRDAMYVGLNQPSLKINTKVDTGVSVSGTYGTVNVIGAGAVDLNSSSVQTLDVQSSYNLEVTAGTVRELIVVQPDVCPSDTLSDSTVVSVEGVTSGEMTYNGQKMAAMTYRTSCASVIFEAPNDEA